MSAPTTLPLKCCWCGKRATMSLTDPTPWVLAPHDRDDCPWDDQCPDYVDRAACSEACERMYVTAEQVKREYASAAGTIERGLRMPSTNPDCEQIRVEEERRFDASLEHRRKVLTPASDAMAAKYGEDWHTRYRVLIR